MTEGSTTAYIGEGLTLFGSVSGGSDMQIDGKIEGSVTLDGDVLVGPPGVVRGPLEARCVAVEGRVFGDVSASDLVRVGRGGVLRGDVRAPRAALDEGGTLEGAIEMDLGLDRLTSEPEA